MFVRPGFSACIHRASYFTSAFEVLSKELFYPTHPHIKACTHILTEAHDNLYISWASSIALNAALIRTLVTFPFYIYSEQNQAKVMYISLDCQKSSKELLCKLEKSDGYYNLSKKKQNILYNKMAPLWITFSIALRSICGFYLNSGYGWPTMIPGFVYESLDQPCTSMLFPMIVFFANLANSELLHLRRPMLSDPKSPGEIIKPPTPLRISRFIGWFANLAILYCSYFIPKAVIIYWATSAVHQLFIHLFVMHPKVREFFGIYLLPHEGVRPYQHLFISMRKRYWLFNYLDSKK